MDLLQNIKRRTHAWDAGAPDLLFLLLVLSALLCGAFVSFSAGEIYGETFYDDRFYFLKRYVLFAVLSCAAVSVLVFCATPIFWRGFGVGLFCVSVALLILVLLIGTVGGGAQRWLAIGPITVQPSEIAKPALVMVLALLMTKYEVRITDTRRRAGAFRYGVLMPFSVILFVCLLVAAERHISGLLIIGIIGVFVMFLGGTRIRYLLFAALAVALAGSVLILVSEYAQVRVNTWLHIEQVDPLGSAWQTLQGLYAIGSGGLFGKGFGKGKQKFGYVSQPQNDFVFTIVCEELGFLGAFFVILLFAALVLRGFSIASRAPDRFSSLVVYGLCAKLALQAILNIAVVTNSMPNTGVSLPFFSSGGSFLAIQILEMGIVLSISRYASRRGK